MPVASRVLLTAIFALCWSSVAAAGPAGESDPLDPAKLRAAMNHQLDQAFEKFVSEDRRQDLSELAGPSSMDCSATAGDGGIETCLVTTNNVASTSPAALAHR